MDKKTFIEKYGIQKYEKAKERCRLWHKTKHKRRKEDDFSFIYRFKVPVPDDYVRSDETYDAYRKAEFKMQDHIKKKWYRYSRDPYILVIDWTDTRGGYFKFKAELHKNNITLQDRTVLQQICEETKGEFKITPINIDEDEE